MVRNLYEFLVLCSFFLVLACLKISVVSSGNTATNMFDMEPHDFSMETAGLTNIPYEITQMIVRLLPVEDLKNVACICRTVHEASADILQHYQPLIREYSCFNIDVKWIGLGYDDYLGWDIVRSRPIISLCTILENAKLGHYVRDIFYTPDSKGNKYWFFERDDDEYDIINHNGSLKAAQNVEVPQKYLLEHQLEEDQTQAKVEYPRDSSDPYDQWHDEFVEHLKIDYGLYLRILLPMTPNLTTLEISWNFSPYSPICEVIRAATKGANPFLQHLTKVKLLLGRRAHRMDIGAFMAVYSLRWLSIHHLLEYNRFDNHPDPELVGYSKLTRLELVDCGIAGSMMSTFAPTSKRSLLLSMSTS